jgi:hypothetical protein
MMKMAGVRLAVPLVSQGELIGLLNLGARRSEQEYSSDDRRLLNNLATQAAPALRVAQLARQQQIEARERERMDQELRVARVIQQTLLPKKLPEIQGYKVAAHWQPARAVSGDFYDFFEFPISRDHRCDYRQRRSGCARHGDHAYTASRSRWSPGLAGECVGKSQ